jgi:hypothetical protein
MLDIDMDDVYLLMGLSRRGAPIIFSRHQATSRSIEEYVVEYCITRS